MIVAELLRNSSPRGIFRMWQRNFKVYRKLFLQSMAPTLLEPLIYLLSLGIGLGLLVRQVEGIPYLQFISPGLVASTTLFGASYECTFNSFVRMKYQKTYDAILATPVNIEEIVLGEIFWGATRSLINATAFLAVIWAFGLVKSPLALLLLPLLFISGLMFGVVGMTFTGLVSNISLFNYYFTIFVTPSFLFSGIFFPVKNLPGWAQALASYTPLFHVVRVSRSLALGRLNGTVVADVIYITGLTTLFFLVPVYLMKRKMIK